MVIQDNMGLVGRGLLDCVAKNQEMHICMSLYISIKHFSKHKLD